VKPPDSTFEAMLAGGDRRSLGRVDEVIEAVLARPASFGALFDCLFSGDEIVRMRAGDAIEKVARRRAGLLEPYRERLLSDVTAIEQPSVRWHLAQILPRLELGPRERARAIAILGRNLATYTTGSSPTSRSRPWGRSPKTTGSCATSSFPSSAGASRASGNRSPRALASCSLASRNRYDRDPDVDRHRPQEPRVEGEEHEDERDARPDDREDGAGPGSHEDEHPGDREDDARGDRQGARDHTHFPEQPRVAGVEGSILLGRGQPDGEVYEPVGDEEEAGEDAHARSPLDAAARRRWLRRQASARADPVL
jgi:hypothetical protein